MRIPYLFFLLLCLVQLSCGSKKRDLFEDLKGNWLILYPDHRLSSSEQREVYGRHQDSIVNLYGLKLISLAENGDFNEVDSMFRPSGKWILTTDSQVKIREGGRGFN